MDEPIAFHRDALLPPQAPPGSEIGVLGWLRANLFSNIPNSILTIVSALVIFYLVSHIWPFFAHSVWNADSYAQCRQIIAETWGEGAGGACLAVIRERWQQFMFGFYPVDLYWRPTLAFICEKSGRDIERAIAARNCSWSLYFRRRFRLGSQLA